MEQIRHTLEAILPGKRTQKLLEISPHEPGLLMLRRTETAPERSGAGTQTL